MKKACLVALLLFIVVRGFAQTTITFPCSQDVELFSLTPNTVINTGSYGNQLNANAWTYTGTPGYERSLIQFDISNIPTCVAILNATLTLYNNYHCNDDALQDGMHSHLSGSNAAYIERVLSPWNENTATWNNQPASTPVGQAILPQDVSGHEDYVINVSALVQYMVTNSVNNGFMLRLQNENFYRALIFASSRNPDTALHPKLVVTYEIKTQAIFIPNVQNCSPTVSFTNHSVFSTAYFWNFGDSYTDTATTPTHTYPPGNGSYNVTLIGDPNTVCADTQVHTVTIISGGAAQFASQTQCNLSAQFSNQSSNGSSYHWDFGDGDTSTAVNPTHIYSTVGNYIVQLINNYGSPCADTIYHTVTMVPQGVAAFSSLVQPCDLNVQFLNQSLNAVTSSWNFGDGNTDTTFSPSHIYTVPGTYFVNLYINQNTTCPETLTTTVAVNTTPASAAFSTQPANCNYNVQFSNGSANASSYLWNFGDAATDTSANPQHNYAANGMYNVSLIANPNTLCADTITDSVKIAVAPAIALFNNDQQLCDTNVFFVNQSQNAFTYQWDFGDNATSTRANPTHAYPYEGDYLVTLYVNRNTLCTDSMTKKVHALVPDASALFIPNAFTPNQDGTNDLFRIFNICGGYQLTIFNRWGQKIYETDDADAHPWDGRMKGREVPNGVYCFLIKSSEQVRTGSILLYR